MALVACAGAPVHAFTAATSGRTATFALPINDNPNDILPFATLHTTNVDLFDLQYLMWRPLYWFGQNGKVAYNPSLSIARAPTYSNGGRTVTITLKHYLWSNGKPVTSRDVEFFLNLLRANKSEWEFYIPGEFPDNVTRMTFPNASTFTLTFRKTYNHYWLLYNQLSEIIPLPQQAWDKTGPTISLGNYDSTGSGAQKVFKYLLSQNSQLSTYATNPLWRVVDGPWKLSTFESVTGRTVLTRNPTYSGRAVGNVSRLVELPFTSEFAEYAALRAGEINYGYLPLTDIATKAQLRHQGYTLTSWLAWGIGYQGLNFTSPTVGPILKQLYIRQALAHLVDQSGDIKHIMHGYGFPTYGPVPTEPPSNFVTPFETTDPYPFSVHDATVLLAAHGWRRDAAGVDACVRPGTGPSDCGAGIHAGATLTLTDQYSSGATVLTQVMEALKSDASLAGIALNLTTAPVNTVYGTYEPCTKKTPVGCQWDIKNATEGSYWFTYSPDFYPSGELIFLSGLGGDYHSARAQALIAATQTAQGLGPMYRYENYIAAQLPYLWMPVTPYQISAISSHLRGALP
ncbi:MAG TPA: ABC transporter substrate-binding protein, partial [Verrucomicrobiae bacterium]|nr:ABC transporter substrate-binding protein [Verrucomicrobiae bacterium]